MGIDIWPKFRVDQSGDSFVELAVPRFFYNLSDGFGQTAAPLRAIYTPKVNE